MSDKIKYICIFLVLPVLLVSVFFLSLKLDESKKKEEPTTEEKHVYTDDEINQMLLAEFQKSQSTRQMVEETTEIVDLTPEDQEFDDMIDNTDYTDVKIMSDEELSDEDEAIIAAAEEEAKKNNKASYYGGIEVVSSLNQVQTNGEYVYDLTEEELSAAHPLLLQYDSRWATYPYGMGTMKSSACGPTSFSMVIIALTDIDNASPPRVATYSMNHNYYVAGAGTSHALFTQGCYDFGLYCQEISNDEATMKAHLDNGEMLVLSVHYGNFTHSGAGHFIVIYGYNENGFMVNDPGSYDRSCRYWDFATITGDINRIYALGKQ